MLKMTTSTANGADCALNASALKVTTSTANGTDCALNVGTLCVNNGFSGTLTSTATFSDEAQTREIDFIYDHNGMRTAKIVSENGRVETTEYTLHGKLITHLTKRTVDENGEESTEELYFFYDAQSRPAFVKRNNTMYRYLHTLQGDIVGILDTNGNLVVEYKYDAWGKPTSTTGSLKTSLRELNPFRYRGYVHDEEIGLYYLEKRYYYPERGRFINSDMVFIFTATNSEELLNQNLFAYCRNNPVMEYDPIGIWSWKTFFKAAATVVITAAAVAVTAVTGGTAAAAIVGVKIACSTIDGALSAKASGGDIWDGAFAGSVGGVAQICAESCGSGSIAARAINSSVYDIAYECISTGTLDPDNLALYAVDVGMDSVLSSVNYYYTGGIASEGTKAFIQGGIDSGIDVFQTVAYYNSAPMNRKKQDDYITVKGKAYKKYGGYRNMMMEFGFMN